MLSRVLLLAALFSAFTTSTALAQASCGDVPKDEPFVMVTAPAAGAKVKSGFAVAGCSRTFESTVSLDSPTPPQPGGQAMARPPSTCRWTWNTVWPACALQLNTVR